MAMERLCPLRMTTGADNGADGGDNVPGAAETKAETLMERLEVV
jgi:hypothetical protein